MWNVYGLCDPFTGEIRYIGVTSRSLGERQGEHGRRYRASVLSPTSGPNRPVNQWVASLGLWKPSVALLGAFTLKGDAESEERRLIASHPNLLNVAYSQRANANAETVARRGRRERERARRTVA